MIVENPARARRGGSIAPEDFADIATCTRIDWVADGALDIQFDRDLTPAEEAMVRIRCASSNEAEAALRQQAQNAIAANEQWVATALPQITTGADLIQARPQPAAPTNIAQVNAVLNTLWGDVRNLSLAVESLATERARSVEIENTLIRLALNVLED